MPDRYAVEQEVYKITFASNCRTESNTTDYVRFYYQINGKIYVTQNYGGTAIANAVVYLPTMCSGFIGERIVQHMIIMALR